MNQSLPAVKMYMQPASRWPSKPAFLAWPRGAGRTWATPPAWWAAWPGPYFNGRSRLTLIICSPPTPHRTRSVALGLSPPSRRLASLTVAATASTLVGCATSPPPDLAYLLANIALLRLLTSITSDLSTLICLSRPLIGTRCASSLEVRRPSRVVPPRYVLLRLRAPSLQVK
jgi:hypothetical protein